jgi:hypothetical protein
MSIKAQGEDFGDFENRALSLSQGPHIIHTFDIFDTLIARKCGHPTNIFFIVEMKSGISGFAKSRIRAEEVLSAQKSDFNFDQIYEIVQRDLKINDHDIRSLKGVEMSTEIENAIPISCNIKNLTRSSVLITDMYHNEYFIRKLLYAVGIDFELPIIQTSFGKSQGYVWEHLMRNGVQCWHLGDSAHSDVKMARKYGMRASYSIASEPNIFESKLSQCGLYGLACCFREARLKYFVASEKYQCQALALQNFVNIPLIIYFGAYLVKNFALTGDKKKFLFASRDCRLLHHAVRTLLSKFPSLDESIDTRYWLTSRQSRVYGSAFYLQYCDELARADDCLFVDLVGTGASMHILCDRLNKMLSNNFTSENFFIALNSGFPNSKKGASPPQAELARRYDIKGESMVDEQGQIEHALSHHKTVSGLHLEMLNYTPEGMLRDVVKIQNSYIPWRDQFDLGAFQQDLCLFAQSYSYEFIAHCVNSFDGSIESFLDAVLSEKYLSVLYSICNEARPHLDDFAKEYFLGDHVSSENFVDLVNGLGPLRSAVKRI